MNATAPKPMPDSSVRAAIIAGCLVAFVSFGLSAAFGIFLRPMSESLGWERGVFSLSLAIQGLFWGVCQPFAGMVADRYGTARVLAFGAIVSAVGFWLRANVLDPDIFVLSGLVVGIGTGACSFPVVVVALGKIVTPERRSFIMGLGTAAASLGLFVGAPLMQFILEQVGWQFAIQVIAMSFLLTIPVMIFIARVSRPTISESSSSVGWAIRAALGERSFMLLFLGFFVCGFHVAFMQTHLPAYISDAGLDPVVGSWSLALIGLFNIAGSFGAGWAGQRLSKRNSLVFIYFARAALIAAFILTPLSALSVLIFSSVMGILWLSTVPLTMGIVAQTQGVQFLSTLVGLIFLGHQTGMFAGAWLGGLIFDAYGSYLPMWWAAIILGCLSALVHIPIDERPAQLTKVST